MSQGASNKLMQEIYDQFLICKICYEPYRRPKTLTCLHTFCTECLEKHMDAELERSYRYMLYSRAISCPICRKKTELPSGGIKRLPDNFLVGNLTEVVSRRKTSEKALNCEICKSSSKSAVSKCLDCSKLLCSNCVNSHRKTKVTQEHSLFDIETDTDISCKSHSEECVRFYCEPCEMCICVVCTFQEHKGHELSSFTDGLEKYRNSLQSMLSGCQERIGNIKMQLDLMSNCEQALKSTEEQIHDSAINTIAAVRKKERELVEDLKNIYGDDMINFLQEKQGLQEDLDNLLGTCNLTEIVLKDKNVGLLLLRKEIQGKIHMLMDKKLTEPPPTAIKNVDFVPGSVIFGNLNVDGKDETIKETQNHRMYSFMAWHNTASQTDEPWVEDNFTTMNTMQYDYCNDISTQTSSTPQEDKSTNTCTLEKASYSSTTKKEEVKNNLHEQHKETCDRGTETVEKMFNDKITDTIGLILKSNQNTSTPKVKHKTFGTITDIPSKFNKSTSINKPHTADKMTGTYTPRVPFSNKETETPRILSLDMGINTQMMGENKFTSTRVIVTVDSTVGTSDVRTKDQCIETPWSLETIQNLGKGKSAKQKSGSALKRPLCCNTGTITDPVTILPPDYQEAKKLCVQSIDVQTVEPYPSYPEIVSHHIDTQTEEWIPSVPKISSHDMNTQTMQPNQSTTRDESCMTDILHELIPKQTSHTGTTMNSKVEICDSSMETDHVIVKKPYTVVDKDVNTTMIETVDQGVVTFHRDLVDSSMVTDVIEPISPQRMIPSFKSKISKKSRPSSLTSFASKDSLSCSEGSSIIKPTSLDAETSTEVPGIAVAMAAFINSVTTSAIVPLSSPKRHTDPPSSPVIAKSKGFSFKGAQKKMTGIKSFGSGSKDRKQTPPKVCLIDKATGFDKPYTVNTGVGPDEPVTMSTKASGSESINTSDFGVSVHLPIPSSKEFRSVTTEMQPTSLQDKNVGTCYIETKDTGVDPTGGKLVSVETNTLNKDYKEASTDCHVLCKDFQSMVDLPNPNVNHIGTVTEPKTTRSFATETSKSLTAEKNIGTVSVKLKHSSTEMKQIILANSETNTIVKSYCDTATGECVRSQDAGTSPPGVYTADKDTSTVPLHTTSMGTSTFVSVCNSATEMPHQEFVSIGSNTIKACGVDKRIGTFVDVKENCMMTEQPMVCNKTTGMDRPIYKNMDTNTNVITTCDKEVDIFCIPSSSVCTMTSPMGCDQETLTDNPTTTTSYTSMPQKEYSDKEICAVVETVDVGVVKKPHTKTCGTSSSVSVKDKMTHMDKLPTKTVNQAIMTHRTTFKDKGVSAIVYETAEVSIETNQVLYSDSGTGMEKLEYDHRATATNQTEMSDRGSSPIRQEFQNRGASPIRFEGHHKEVSVKPLTQEVSVATQFIKSVHRSTSMPGLKSIDKGVSPIKGLGVESKGTGMVQVKFMDSITSTDSFQSKDVGSNTRHIITVDRESDAVKVSLKDQEVSAIVPMATTEASTPRIEMVDTETGMKQIRKLDCSTSMAQVVLLEKETSMQQIHYLNKNVCTENITTADKQTATIVDVTAQYKDHVSLKASLTVSRGIMAEPCTKDGQTSPPAEKIFVDRACSPRRVILVDKGISANKAEIMEVKDKFQAPQLATPKSVFENEDGSIFRPALDCIREGSQEQSDDDNPNDNIEVFTDKAAEARIVEACALIHRETMFSTSPPRSGNGGSTFNSSGDSTSSNILCTVETGTNTPEINQEHKETSTPPIETEERGMTTEIVLVDTKMAECITKLKTVRQRLEQPPSNSPPSSPSLRQKHSASTPPSSPSLRQKHSASTPPSSPSLRQKHSAISPPSSPSLRSKHCSPPSSPNLNKKYTPPSSPKVLALRSPPSSPNLRQKTSPPSSPKVLALRRKLDPERTAHKLGDKHPYSSGEESESSCGWPVYEPLKMRSKSFGDNLHVQDSRFCHMAPHRHPSTESMYSSTAASDSGTDTSSKPRLARKQRLDITQLLRQSSVPEGECLSLSTPKLHVQTVQRQVIPQLNVDDYKSKGSKDKSIKQKKLHKHRSSEETKAFSSPDITPQMRRRLHGKDSSRTFQEERFPKSMKIERIPLRMPNFDERRVEIRSFPKSSMDIIDETESSEFGKSPDGLSPKEAGGKMSFLAQSRKPKYRLDSPEKDPFCDDF